MKPEQLAKRLNITSATLRNWAGKEFSEFLSPSGQGQHGAKRSFTDTDARVLAWIADLRNQNVPSSEIITTLRNAKRANWRSLPELPPELNDEIALVPREAVEERAKGLEERFRLQLAALEKERDAILAQNEELKNENSELRHQLMEVTTQLLDLNRRLTALLEKEQKRRK